MNIEIKEATLRKEKVDQEWGYVKVSLITPFIMKRHIFDLDQEPDPRFLSDGVE